MGTEAQAQAQAPEGGVMAEASAPTTHDFVLETQGLTDVSEAELQGLTPEAPSTTADSGSSAEGDKSKDATKPADADTKPEDTKPEDTKPEDKDTKPADKDTKPADKDTKPADKESEARPPKGFVKLEALREVRGENRYLKEKLADLEQRLEQRLEDAPKAPAPTPVEATFKILTDEEFTELAESSPSDAQVYMYTLNRYERALSEQQIAEQRAQLVQEREEQQLSDVYAKTSELMEKALPTVFDPDAEETKAFYDYVEEIGFPEDLFFLTNPATKVIPPGQTKAVPFGTMAATLLQALVNAQKATKVETQSVDVDAIRAEITKEVLAKVKTGEGFRSLSTAPESSASRPEFSDRVLSEAEFAKLSEAEQDAYLSGT